MEEYGLTEDYRFTAVHNYIDMDSMILRKGGVSARKDEMLFISMNMRDGSLVCIGKGNEDWNFSASYGAGRRMSRTKAYNSLILREYRKQMEGIWSSCISRKTLDESPMSYKPMKEIIRNLEPTADIIRIIKPVYNYKAVE